MIEVSEGVDLHYLKGGCGPGSGRGTSGQVQLQTEPAIK